MGSSSPTIEKVKASSSNLYDASETFKTKLDTISTKFNLIKNCVEKMNNYWEGSAKDSHNTLFYTYYDPVIDQIEKFKKNIGILNQIAGIYDTTEKNIIAMSEDLPENIFS